MRTLFADEKVDAAVLAKYERRVAAEESVTFEDVIEDVAAFNPARKQVFMEALESGDHYTVWLLCDQARDRLIEKKLKGE